METRIIKAVFGASKSIVAPKRFKNDWGQVLELVGITLPQTFTAHFANSKTGTAKKRVGQNNQVDVPDEFFTSGADIYCWVMVHDTVSDGRTMYTVRIPIEDRGTATDEEPTPVQQDVIEQAISALNSAVEKTAQDVESADASAQSAKADADRAETARDTAEEYVSTVQNYAQQAQASANNASASATASAQSASTAQQIKTDVQGLVSDAQSAASASAQSATESTQSAYQASTSASSASQSAETANTKASEASASAQTASTKAAEASGYASTASAKASEASQSASAASGYATAAGQAKTAAETAQGLAEQAQSDAESAKDDAESARDEAQQIVSGISSKVEQIDQNTSNIASLEADRYKAYATDTATGAVASFPDGADNIPMADVLVNIDPVQDLHGQKNPYPAGSGKNKINQDAVWADFKQSDGSFAGIVNGSGGIYSKKSPIPADLVGKQLTFSAYTAVPTGSTATNIRVEARVNGSDIFGNRNGDPTYKLTAVTFTPTSVNDYVCVSYGEGGQIQFKGVQLEEGSTATTYAPYSNICPISGWNGCNISHSGADTTNPTVYPISWQSEAGTVYGGNLDVTTGMLMVDWAMVDLGTLSWSRHGTYTNVFLAVVSDCAKGISGKEQIICDRYESVGTRGTSSLASFEKAISLQTNYAVVLVSDSSFTDATAFKSAMNGVQAVYELAEPITYTLDPVEIRSLLGINNVFADTGDSTVEYRADTKLYISKKIAEAVNALA